MDSGSTAVGVGEGHPRSVKEGKGKKGFLVGLLLGNLSSLGSFLNGSANVQEEGVGSPAADYYDQVVGDACQVYPHCIRQVDAMYPVLFFLKPKDGIVRSISLFVRSVSLFFIPRSVGLFFFSEISVESTLYCKNLRQAI